MKNPFPGMNPWLEDYWRDVHASLLVYARDQLNRKLPDDLTASVDERLAIDVGEERPCAYVPDVSISESWDNPVGPALGAGGVAVEAAEPIVLDQDEMKVRRLEIADSAGHLITVLEFLSPTNKVDEDHRFAWGHKRRENLAAGLNFVEIDLVRAGGWTLPDHKGLLRLPPNRVCHAICATRAWRLSKLEFYVCPLRERLKVIRVPLRRGEPDVALDLQALVDQCYELGRYDKKINYGEAPVPALPPEELAWTRDVLGSSV
jgi:hypothetical protein